MLGVNQGSSYNSLPAGYSLGALSLCPSRWEAFDVLRCVYGLGECCSVCVCVCGGGGVSEVCVCGGGLERCVCVCARVFVCARARMCVRVCCGDGPSVPLQLRTKRAYSGLAMMVCIHY